jgi:hypothetical protein
VGEETEVIILDRRQLRRRSVPAFIRQLALRHPELKAPVTYEAFLAIAEREEVAVRVVHLSRPARLIRIGRHACIQLNKKLTRAERAVPAMHEMCHYWRDDPKEPYYNVEEDVMESREEEFADIFAWVVTSPARVFLPGLKEEDF